MRRLLLVLFIKKGGGGGRLFCDMPKTGGLVGSNGNPEVRSQTPVLFFRLSPNCFMY